MGARQLRPARPTETSNVWRGLPRRCPLALLPRASVREKCPDFSTQRDTSRETGLAGNPVTHRGDERRGARRRVGDARPAPTDLQDLPVRSMFTVNQKVSAPVGRSLLNLPVPPHLWVPTRAGSTSRRGPGFHLSAIEDHEVLAAQSCAEPGEQARHLEVVDPLPLRRPLRRTQITSTPGCWLPRHIFGTVSPAASHHNGREGGRVRKLLEGLPVRHPDGRQVDAGQRVGGLIAPNPMAEHRRLNGRVVPALAPTLGRLADAGHGRHGVPSGRTGSARGSGHARQVLPSCSPCQVARLDHHRMAA